MLCSTWFWPKLARVSGISHFAGRMNKWGPRRSEWLIPTSFCWVWEPCRYLSPCSTKSLTWGSKGPGDIGMEICQSKKTRSASCGSQMRIVWSSELQAHIDSSLPFISRIRVTISSSCSLAQPTDWINHHLQDGILRQTRVMSMGQRPRMGVNLPQSYKGYFSNPLSGSIPNMNPFVGAIKKDQSTRMWHQNVVSIPLALTVIGPLTERNGEMVSWRGKMQSGEGKVSRMKRWVEGKQRIEKH